jgi:GTP cyclohydrolase-4
MNNNIPDIHYLEPEYKYVISNVGISKFIQPVNLIIHEITITVPAEFSISIELPDTYRAAHMSRNIEAAKKVIWQDKDILKTNNIQDICPKIAKELLISHEYSTRSNVEMTMDYFAPRLSPTRKLSNLECFTIKLGATARRRGQQLMLLHSLEIIVEGTTTCPCAQNQSKFITLQRLSNKGIILDKNIENELIFYSHMQRAKVCIRLENMKENSISIDDLISLAEDSMSNGTQGLLKRDDEEALIRKAFLNPMLVEDVVRKVANNLRQYSHMIGEATDVNIFVETQESIHKHNAFAHISTTIGDLQVFQIDDK